MIGPNFKRWGELLKQAEEGEEVQSDRQVMSIKNKMFVHFICLEQRMQVPQGRKMSWMSGPIARPQAM